MKQDSAFLNRGGGTEDAHSRLHVARLVAVLCVDGEEAEVVALATNYESEITSGRSQSAADRGKMVGDAHGL